MSKQTVELFAKVVRLLFIVQYIAGNAKREQKNSEATTNPIIHM